MSATADPRYRMLVAMAERELEFGKPEKYSLAKSNGTLPAVTESLADKAWQARRAAIEKGLGIEAVYTYMLAALREQEPSCA